jgi:hypothetical protein
LQGDLNNWYETILNPQKPASTMTDEELAKYEFLRLQEAHWVVV